MRNGHVKRGRPFPIFNPQIFKNIAICIAMERFWGVIKL